MVGFDLLVITDRNQAIHPLTKIIKAVAEVGKERVAFQLREKDLSPRELLSLAEEILPLTRRHGSSLFINDRVDVALVLNADGVQLNHRSISAGPIKKLIGNKLLLGLSVHSVDEATENASDAADFLVLGPIFETPSKVKYGPPIGIAPLEETRSLTSQPVYAIGGIKANQINALVHSSKDGIAVISAINCAKNPAEATDELLVSIDSARKKSMHLIKQPSLRTG